MLSSRKLVIVLASIFLVVFAAGCKKKIPAPPPPPPTAPPPAPPPPPPPAAPSIVSFSADPSSIQRGQSSNLSWSVSGQTTSISINQGVGVVAASGSQRVMPNESTTYTLTATGPGGSVNRTATVTVTVPPPPPPPPPPAKPTIEQRLFNEVHDAFFDYDKSDVRSDARDSLTQDAAALKSIMADFPNATIMIEGHCDERGSAEYNLGLGDRRSTSAKDFLVQLGVSADKLKTISYGKERPQCTESNEECWQKNRRVHFVAAPQ
ncbi:MAG TPA: peptidoglycan-associated lipoprotein Pal [Bryobacteraceae bacterium]|nr:peptidoglycan-associated lipoprotein Pal [Bryobacteraceae bacterium]